MAKEKTQPEAAPEPEMIDDLRPELLRKFGTRRGLDSAAVIDPFLFMCGMVAAGGEKYAEVVVERAAKILKELEAHRAKQAGVTTNT